MTHSVARVTEYHPGGAVVVLHVTRDELALYRCPAIGARVSVSWIETEDEGGAIPRRASPAAAPD